MSDTKVLTDNPPAPGLAYSAEMVQRMRDLISKEIAAVQDGAADQIADLKTKAAADINKVEETTKRRVEELRHALREIESRQLLLPTFHSLLPEGSQGYPEQVGRDPYAGAPAWADRTDERVKRINSLREDGTEAGEGAES
jgi:hypothetical protein